MERIIQLGVNMAAGVGVMYLLQLSGYLAVMQ